jgi:hypothetical protein
MCYYETNDTKGIILNKEIIIIIIIIIFVFIYFIYLFFLFHFILYIKALDKSGAGSLVCIALF